MIAAAIYIRFYYFKAPRAFFNPLTLVKQVGASLFTDIEEEVQRD